MFHLPTRSRIPLTGLGLAAVAALTLAVAPAPAAHADGDRFSIGFGVQFSSHDRYRSHHRPCYSNTYRRTVTHYDRSYHRPYYRPPFSYERKTVYRSPSYYRPVYHAPAPVSVVKRTVRPARVYCPPPRTFVHQSKVVRVVDDGRRGKGKGHGNKGKGKGKGKKR